MITGHRNRYIIINLFVIFALLTIPQQDTTAQNQQKSDLPPAPKLPMSSQSGGMLTPPEFPYYYYYNGQPIKLTAQEGQMMVGVRDNVSTLKTMAAENSLFASLDNQHLWSAPDRVNIWKVKTAAAAADLSSQIESVRSLPEVVFASPLFGTSSESYSFVGDSIIVQLKSDVDSLVLEDAASNLGICKDHALIPDENVWIFKICKPGINALEAANRLYESGLVEFADPNFYTVTQEPISSVDDSAQSKNSSSNTFDDWYLQRIKASGAWSLASGHTQGTKPVIAILDTGVQLTNTDLSPNLVTGFDAVIGELDPNTGQRIDTHGGVSPICPHFHGTAMAGIAAGIGGSSSTVTGVAGNFAKIEPIRIFMFICANGKTDIVSNTNWDVSGIYEAINQNANVINMSWGDFPDPAKGYPSDSLRTAIENAYDRKIVLIAAAGNNGMNTKGSYFPAAYPQVIQVGGTDRSDHIYLSPNCSPSPERKCGSNYGPQQAIMAPGDDIDTLHLDNSLGPETGTSASAPMVAGVAAIMKAVSPNLSPLQVREILQRTAGKVGGYDYNSDSKRAGWDIKMGYGLLDAEKAVRAVLNPPQVTFHIALKLMPAEAMAKDVAIAVLENESSNRYTFLFGGYTATNYTGYGLIGLSGVTAGDYLVCAKPRHYLWSCLPIHVNADNSANPSNLDFTQGGYLFVPGDFNLNGEDGIINASDIEAYRSHWGGACYWSYTDPDCAQYDINLDGVINSYDWVNSYVYGLQKHNEAWEYIKNMPWRPFNNGLNLPSNIFTAKSVSRTSEAAGVTIYPISSCLVGSYNCQYGINLNLSSLSLGAGSANLIIHFDPGVLNVVDDNSSVPGIQVTMYNSIFDQYDGGLADNSSGEINLGTFNASSTKSGSTKQGLLATISFTPIAGIDHTQLWGEWRQAETALSNISEYNTSTNLITSITPLDTYVDGSPMREMPTVTIGLEDGGNYINTNRATLVMNPVDPYNQVQKVAVQVQYDYAWHLIGYDDNPKDGWSIDWFPGDISDQFVYFYVQAFLPGGQYGFNYSQAMYIDRAKPKFISASFSPAAPAWPASVTTTIQAADDETADYSSGVQKIEQYVNEATDASSSGNWIKVGEVLEPGNTIDWSTAGFLPGLHQVIFNIEDKAGNWNRWEDPDLPVIVYGNYYTLRVSKAGTGSGTVTSSLDGINCGPTCSHEFPENAVVTLTATPTSPSTFYGWDGGGCYGTGTCTVTMSSAQSITATFMNNSSAPILLVDDDDNAPDVRSYYTDTLSALGKSYDVWDTNNSDAEPDAATLANYDVVIWFSGDVYGGYAGPGAAGEVALSTFLDGGGRLLISSQDYFYDRGLTAFASNYLGVGAATSDVGQTTVTGVGSIFTGLGPFALTYPFTNYSDLISPDATAENAFGGDQGNAAVHKNGEAYCTAYLGFPFEAIAAQVDRQQVMSTFLNRCSSYTLSISKIGTGSGTVTSDPPGIDCGSDCSETYPYGTSVVLTATPETGAIFIGWGGDASGAGNPLQIEMNGDKTVIAQFEKATFTDVPVDYSVSYGGVVYPLHDHIQALYNAGYTKGCSTNPLSYCPDNTLTRVEAAVFMLRGLLGTSYAPPTDPAGYVFTDNWSSPTVSWGRPWAEGMWDEGLTAGCQASPKLFCPTTTLTRAEASVFGLRIENGAGYTPPAATHIFADDWSSPTINWAEVWAEQAYLHGLLPACGESGGKPLFCPADLVTRAWAAYLIVEAKDLLPTP